MARPKPIVIKINPTPPQFHETLKKYFWVVTNDGEEPKLVTGTMEEWKKFIKGEIQKEVDNKLEEYFSTL